MHHEAVPTAFKQKITVLLANCATCQYNAGRTYRSKRKATLADKWQRRATARYVSRFELCYLSMLAELDLFLPHWQSMG